MYISTYKVIWLGVILTIGLGVGIYQILRIKNTNHIPQALTREEFLAEQKEVSIPKTAPSPEPEQKTNQPVQKPPQNTPQKKEAINLNVLFVPQAPHQVWDTAHNDACEESVALMAYAYVNSITKMSLDEMDERMFAMQAWEDQTFGYNKDTNASEITRMLREFLNVPHARVVHIKSITDIEQELQKGYPVLIPADGRALKNPYFRNGGPEYHTLVIKGYTESAFITNDPGTRRGADYLYEKNLLFEAIHDWNDGNVSTGEKVMITISP